MNQSRVGVFCLGAKILGKCGGEETKTGWPWGSHACKLYLCLGCVAGFQLARFQLSPQLGLPCLVPIPLCYIKCVYDVGTHFKK